MEMIGKPVSASLVEMDEIVQPSDINLHGSIFGGHLMSLVDKAAGIAAYRHSGKNVVTLSVDRLRRKFGNDLIRTRRGFGYLLEGE